MIECSSVPDFMVICGGNGCGKSSVLEALMTAKERAGAYGNFTFDPKVVSANAQKARIQIRVSFSEAEREFVKRLHGEDCPEKDDIEIEILKGGQARTVKRSTPTNRLFSYYSASQGSPGFFDYITAHRQTVKQNLQSWDASYLSDERAKKTLAGVQNKFQQTKLYLAGLKMGDLQNLQSSLRSGTPTHFDSLTEIRDTFDRFFAPLKFVDVYLDKSPFEFVIETPLGAIDIDDLSSGEKEIFNIFVRFHQLNPNGAVILFDEADAHLHPDLERRYLKELRGLVKGNQLLLTTHSPEMMIEAGSEALYTILKEPLQDAGNQLQRVTQDQNLHEVLSELMGARGLISFNQRIVFIEGENASADREIYETFFPPSKHNISFVPAGNSSTVKKTAERVNALLAAATSFQEYYCIIDKDIEREDSDHVESDRLFRLTVYHVENFLLDPEVLLKSMSQLCGPRCPFSEAKEIEEELKKLVLEEIHLNSYTKAVLDAKIAELAKKAYDAVFSGKTKEIDLEGPDFESAKASAKSVLEKSLVEGDWKRRAKGRDLLKSFCARYGLKYEHFKNVVISNFSQPPDELEDIISKIKRKSINTGS